MRILRTVAVIVPLLGAAVSAQVAAPAPAPAPPTQAPSAPPAPAGQAPVVPAPTTPVTPTVARTFLAPTGMIFNAVRPERVADFELVIGYLEAALAQATSPQVRAQAKGWRSYKATEPGPNGTVLYVFLFDPTVAGADYALGPILSDAFPNEVEQIWKLYQGALAGGGSLLNLTSVKPPPLPAAGEPVPLPGTAGAPAAPQPAPKPGAAPPATTPGAKPPAADPGAAPSATP